MEEISPSGGGEGVDSGTSPRESSEDHGFVRWLCLTIYVMSHEPSCKQECPISNVRFLFSFTGLWNLIACQCVVLTSVVRTITSIYNHLAIPL